MKPMIMVLAAFFTIQNPTAHAAPKCADIPKGTQFKNGDHFYINKPFTIKSGDSYLLASKGKAKSQRPQEDSAVEARCQIMKPKELYTHECDVEMGNQYLTVEEKESSKSFYLKGDVHFSCVGHFTDKDGKEISEGIRSMKMEVKCHSGPLSMFNYSDNNAIYALSGAMCLTDARAPDPESNTYSKNGNGKVQLRNDREEDGKKSSSSPKKGD